MDENKLRKGDDVTFKEFRGRCPKCNYPYILFGVRAVFIGNFDGKAYFDLLNPTMCIKCFDVPKGVFLLGTHDPGSYAVYNDADYSRHEHIKTVV